MYYWENEPVFWCIKNKIGEYIHCCFSWNEI